jgi:ABC-2 type transport system permease protein
MTTLTIATPKEAEAKTSGVTQWRVINSEWIKLRSLRSTIFTLLAAVVCTVGLGLLISALRANDIKTNGFQPGPQFDPTLISLRGIYLAQLPIAVLGVLMITGEYGTGMIRATLSALPKRVPVLWAKALVFAVVVFVVGFVASFVAFVGGQALLHSALSGIGVHVSLGTNGALRAILGGGLYLTAVGLFGVGLGFMIRNTAGAIAALFGALLVLPSIISALPQSLYNDIFKYLPLPAGTQVLTTHQDHSLLGPWSGIGILALYAAAALAGGLVVLRRSDA